MMFFLQSLVAFIVALGLLVTFHEFGHFWCARRCGVKVLRFSIGFGKPLWSRKFGEDDCELVVAALPLGGYVKMLDERDGDTVSPEEAHRAFNNKTLGQRAAIVVAGPLFNFIFAVGAFWLMFMIGISGPKPVVGDVVPGSPADYAGFQSGDEIVAVDKRETRTWAAVFDVAVAGVVSGRTMRFRVRDDTGEVRALLLETAQFSIDDMAQKGLLQQLGLAPERVEWPAVVGRVTPGAPAAEAGLLAGDLIVAADGESVKDWRHWVEYVRARPERMITLEVERRGRNLLLSLTPVAKPGDDGATIGFVGVAARPITENLARDAYAPAPAFFKSIEKTWDTSWFTLNMLGKLIFGQASIKNLSGPVGIAQFAGVSAQSGFTTFMWFLGVLSVSLGVLNLLPIPLLDGGHLLYYLFEFVRGREVPESAQIIMQRLGLTLLLCLTVIVLYNDLVRVFS